MTMRFTSVLLAVSALNLIVACSAPLQSSDVPLVGSAQSAERNAGMRTLRGLIGGITAPTAPRALEAPRGWPTKNGTAPILFVSDLENSVVEMYDPNTRNPSPEGSITDGISFPSGLAVDKSGTLYVSNFGGGGSVQEYPAGQSSPSLTITAGLASPEGIAVDSHGNVFVANTSTFTVVAYKPGQTAPYETIDLTHFGQPVGLAVDSHNNVWAAIDTPPPMVVEIPAGSSSGENSGFTNLASPVGISIGENDRIFVSNIPVPSSGQGYVNVYEHGSTTPTYTITKGIGPGLNGPTLNGLTHKDWFFQSNQYGAVSGYKKGKKKPFSSISGLGNPSGIASSPEVRK